MQLKRQAWNIGPFCMLTLLAIAWAWGFFYSSDIIWSVCVPFEFKSKSILWCLLMIDLCLLMICLVGITVASFILFFFPVISSILVWSIPIFLLCVVFGINHWNFFDALSICHLIFALEVKFVGSWCAARKGFQQLSCRFILCCWLRYCVVLVVFCTGWLHYCVNLIPTLFFHPVPYVLLSGPFITIQCRIDTTTLKLLRSSNCMQSFYRVKHYSNNNDTVVLDDDLLWVHNHKVLSYCQQML